MRSSERKTLIAYFEERDSALLEHLTAVDFDLAGVRHHFDEFDRDVRATLSTPTSGAAETLERLEALVCLLDDRLPREFMNSLAPNFYHQTVLSTSSASTRPRLDVERRGGGKVRIAMVDASGAPVWRKDLM